MFLYDLIESSFDKQSVKCVALANHALACDWYNISLATIADAERLVRFVLCVIDSS